MKTKLLLFAFMTVFLSSNLFAQQKEMDGGPRGMSRVDREKIEALINWKIVEYLELDEETSNKLLPLMKQYNDKRHSLYFERREIAEKLMKLSENENVTIKDASAELKELDNFYDQIDENRNTFFKKAKSFLTDRQYIKLKIVEERLKSDFMRQLRERNEPPPPPER